MTNRNSHGHGVYNKENRSKLRDRRNKAKASARKADRRAVMAAS